MSTTAMTHTDCSHHVPCARLVHLLVIIESPLGLNVEVSGQGADSCRFVLAHEAAVAFDIGAKDSSEFALHTHFSTEAIILLPPHGCQLAGAAEGNSLRV
jgi:hypothetical protein